MKNLLFTIFLFSEFVLFAQKPKLVLPVGHTKTIYSAQFSPDSKYVVTASKDKTAKMWESSSGKLLYSLEGFDYSVNSAQFSPDGKNIVTASSDKTIKIWESNSGKLLYIIRDSSGFKSAQYSPDGKCIVSSSWDKTAKVWEISSGKLLLCLNGHTNIVNSAQFSPDGKYIVTASEDNTAKIWDSKNGKLCYSLKGHSDIVNSAQFSPDGKHIVTSSNDSTAKIWESSRGKICLSINGHTGVVHSAQFSPDGKYIIIASEDSIAGIWESNSGKFHGFVGHSNYISSAIYSPDGEYILTIDDDVKIWESNSRKLLRKMEGRTECVFSAQFSPDGKNIVAMGHNYLKIWEIVNGKLIDRPDGYYYFARLFIPSSQLENNKCLLMATWDSTKESGESHGRKILMGLQKYGNICATQISPDGKYIVTVGFDSTAKIWEVGNNKILYSLQGHKGKVNSAQYSPNGEYIVTASSDSTAKIWESSSRKLLYSLEGHKAGLYSAECSPNSKYIVTTSSDQTAKIWESSSGKLLHSIEGLTIRENFTQFDPDSKHIITASVDRNGIIASSIRNAKIWDVASGNLIKNIVFKGVFYDINWDKQLIISYENSSLYLYDLRTGKEMLSWVAIDSTDWAVISPSGFFDASPGAMGELYFVKELEVIPLESYYEQFYRPNLWERIMKGEEIENANIDFNNQKPTPDLKITNPSSGKINFRGDVNIGLTTNEIDLKLEYSLTDRGGGINEIRVFQNGKLVHSTLETINQKDQSIQRNSFIKLLSGINTIKVTAFNNDRIEKSETTVIEYTGIVQEPPILYVIAIGINEYQKSSYNLNYAVPDANSFKEAIDKGAKDIFAEVIITSIQNSEATKETILKSLKEIQSKCKQGDVFVFYYAGHGSMSVVNEEDKSVFYLVPYEITNLYSDEILQKYGISAGELQTISKGIKAQKQLFVLDACQSGGAVNVLANRGAIEEKAMALLARSTGTYFLTASGSEQLAGEFAILRHGVFTFALLQGLSGQADANKDGKISVKELSLFVENKVPELSEKYKGNNQFPVSYGFGQDFPLVINGKFIINENSPELGGKYSGYSIDELEKMKKDAAAKEDFDLAKDLKNEIERRNKK